MEALRHKYIDLRPRATTALYEYFKVAVLFRGDLAVELYKYLEQWHVEGESDRFSKSKMLRVKSFSKLSGAEKKTILENWATSEKMRYSIERYSNC